MAPIFRKKRSRFCSGPQSRSPVTTTTPSPPSLPHNGRLNRSASRRRDAPSRTDGGDLAFGLVPVRSWAAANSLRDAAFSTAAAFRILSTKPPADIAAELDAPA